jgi:hypothetical protein
MSRTWILVTLMVPALFPTPVEAEPPVPASAGPTIPASPAATLLPTDAARAWRYRVSTSRWNILMRQKKAAPEIREVEVRVQTAQAGSDRLIVYDGKEQRTIELSRTPRDVRPEAAPNMPARSSFFERPQIAVPLLPKETRWETVKVPAGEFRAAIVDKAASVAFGSFRWKAAFAPGVGLVREEMFFEVEGGACDVVWELVSRPVPR